MKTVSWSPWWGVTLNILNASNLSIAFYMNTNTYQPKAPAKIHIFFYIPPTVTSFDLKELHIYSVSFTVHGAGFKSIFLIVLIISKSFCSPPRLDYIIIFKFMRWLTAHFGSRRCVSSGTLFLSCAYIIVLFWNQSFFQKSFKATCPFFWWLIQLNLRHRI